MRSALRVLHVITRMNVGGAAGFALDMSRLLANEGVESAILSGREPTYEGSLEPHCHEVGVPLIRAPSLQRSPSPLADHRALRELRKVIEFYKPDIVHTHTAKAGFLGRLAAKQSRVPSVHHIHGWTFSEQSALLRGLLRVAERKAATWSRFLLAVCESDVLRGLEMGIGRREQYQIVPAGIDIEAVERAARTPDPDLLAWRGDRCLIGFVGRLCEQKDPLTFVAACQEVRRVAPGRCRFLLVGDGPLARSVDRRVARSGLGQDFRWEGFRPDVGRVLGALDVLVHPSRHEGMPRLLLEAFAAGTPVVATRVGGCAEILGWGRAGIVVPKGDPVATAKGVLALLDDGTLRDRLVEAARSQLPAFDLAACARRLLEVYGFIMGKP